jgi:3-(3-hydroxy-phenyl)propionate hydroxylase
VIAGVAPETRRRWAALGVVAVDRPGAAVSGWLAEHGAQALVLRPDRYVLGLARTPADLDRLARVVPG